MSWTDDPRDLEDDDPTEDDDLGDPDRDRSLLQMNDLVGHRVVAQVTDIGECTDAYFVNVYVRGILRSSTGRSLGDDGPLYFTIFDGDESVLEICADNVFRVQAEDWPFQDCNEAVRHQLVLARWSGSCSIRIFRDPEAIDQ